MVKLVPAPAPLLSAPMLSAVGAQQGPGSRPPHEDKGRRAESGLVPVVFLLAVPSVPLVSLWRSGWVSLVTGLGHGAVSNVWRGDI